MSTTSSTPEQSPCLSTRRTILEGDIERFAGQAFQAHNAQKAEASRFLPGGRYSVDALAFSPTEEHMETARAIGARSRSFFRDVDLLPLSERSGLDAPLPLTHHDVLRGIFTAQNS